MLLAGVAKNQEASIKYMKTMKISYRRNLTEWHEIHIKLRKEKYRQRVIVMRSVIFLSHYARAIRKVKPHRNPGQLSPHCTGVFRTAKYGWNARVERCREEKGFPASHACAAAEPGYGPEDACSVGEAAYIA